MRVKDEQKKQALFDATIKLVNEIGFASSSVSKIAKEAGVSSSTLYVFFENKEDLIVSTYLELKHRMSSALLVDFDDTSPIRDIIKNSWFRLYTYISEHLDEYAYLEQFANSPYSDRVDMEVVEKEFEPLSRVFEMGIRQKIIKNVDMDIIVAFIFSPLSRLANPRLQGSMEMDEEKLEKAFDMTWDAIKF